MSVIVSINDPLNAPTRGTAAQTVAYGAANGAIGFYADYINEVYRLAPLVSLDGLLVVSQSAVETACWTSQVWQSRGNPAGIGWTGDPTQNAASPIFTTGVQAARSHLAHLLLYTTGQIGRGGLVPADDSRYTAYVQAHGNSAVAGKLADLSGQWAVDPNYGQAIAGHANAIMAEPITTPAPGVGGGTNVTIYPNMTQDLIPLPPFETRIVTDAENAAWNNLGPRTVKGFVLHRMLGSLTGTDGWFRRGAASDGLTDWGSDAASGTVYLWNSPLGFGDAGVSANRAPWASGPYNANGDAWGDGKAFVTKYGIDAVNRDETAWEISGNYGDPWSPAAQAAAAQACAHYAHNYGIQWDQFPVHPQDGFSFVRWHQEITGPAEKICPGPVVMDTTNAWIEQVRAILKAAQTQGATPVPTPIPAPVPKPPTPAPTPAPTPTISYIAGVDKGLAAAWFGKATGDDGKIYAYDEIGPLSQAWLANGAKTGAYPAIVSVRHYDTRMYATFTSGLVLWQPNVSAPIALLKAA